MAAVAPTVSINDPGDGQGGTSVSLSVTLGGGTYTSIVYLWSVEAGSLASADTATPTWTRPDVSVQTLVRIRCDVTVTDSSDSTTATNFDRYSVNVNPTSLPDADAPSMFINDPGPGNEETTVTLSASIGLAAGGNAGTFDNLGYAWTVDVGGLAGANTATPSWTRPIVSSGTVTAAIGLTITASGTGTNAANGTTDTASDTLQSVVNDIELPDASAPSTVTINNVPDGSEGTDISLGVTYGSDGLFDGAPSLVWTVSAGSLNSSTALAPVWTRPTVSINTTVTITAAVTFNGSGTTAKNGTSETVNLTATTLVRNVVGDPPAEEPAITINVVPDGAEHTSVTLGITQVGGTFDDITYNWSATGGSIVSGQGTTTPRWRRPAVSSDTNYQINLDVTVTGDGTSAQDGSIATGSYQATARVLNSFLLPPLAPSITISGDTAVQVNGTVSLTASISGSSRGALTYSWNVGGGGSLDPLTGTSSTFDAPSTAGISNVTCTVTATGDGITATMGTDTKFDTHAITRSLDVPVDPTDTTTEGNPDLPVAVAPENVTIRAVHEAPGGYIVMLRAFVQGGTYDSLTFDWTTTGGELDSGMAERPVWTRPTVSASTTIRLSVIVTAHGDDILVRNNTSATASATINATVGVEEDIPEGPVMLIEGTEVRVYAESADEALTITDEIRTEKQLSAVLLTGNYPKPARGNTVRYVHRQIRTTADTPMFNGFIVSSVEFEVTRGLIRYKIVAADAIRAFRKAVVTTAWKGDTLRDIFLDILGDPDIASLGVTGHPDQAEGDTSEVVVAALKGGFELIRSLADLSERVYHSDDRKRVRMSTLTEDAGGVDVRDNSGHLVGAIATAEDDDENFNAVYVTGPSYRGDATREHLPTVTDQTIFVLSRPIFAILQPNAGNSETAGLTDSGAAWTYDQGGTVLTRGAGGSFTGTSLTVDYYPIEFIAEVERDSQDIQRRGLSPLPLQNSARTKEEARQLAKAELARYRILRNSITFRTNNLTFRAGQNITVGKASPPALSGQFVVTKAEYMDRSGNGYMEGTVKASSRVDHDAYEEMFGEGGPGVADLTVEMDQGFPRVEIPVTVTEAAPQAVTATAPTITINAIPAGNENTTTVLGLTFSGGIYDDLAFAWTAGAGTLTGEDTATPSWTRPPVTADTDYEIAVTVTATGDGTNATLGSASVSTASTNATVRDGEAAVAPSVVINTVPAGAEGTTVTLSATITDGAYDVLDYAWTVGDGNLADATTATPTWTRPSVTSTTDYDIDLTVTARGTGTEATDGTSDDATAATVTATVRNIVETIFDSQADFQSYFTGETIGTTAGRWRFDSGGSTPTGTTGPGTNNALEFMHTETSA